jgi:hypothetical protein
MHLNLRNIITSRAEAAVYLREPGDCVIIERGTPRALVLACPCGCGENFPINLDARVGKAWRLYKANDTGAVSVYPSIWRDDGCESHYVIWRDKIYLFGNSEDDFDKEDLPDRLAFSKTILSKLPFKGHISYLEISDTLEANPWDVLSICRSLVRNHQAIEGSQAMRGKFKRLVALHEDGI